MMKIKFWYIQTRNGCVFLSYGYYSTKFSNDKSDIQPHSKSLILVNAYRPIAVRNVLCRYIHYVPHRITQCYLPPGWSDIPAFTPVN